MGQALGNDLDHTRTSNDGGVDDDDVCELVSRLELTLGEGEDAMDAYLVKAMKNNNGAAVLLLTDAFGYNDNDTRDFAYRLSCFGYKYVDPFLSCFQRSCPWFPILSMYVVFKAAKFQGLGCTCEERKAWICFRQC
jgi:hypothetical protein